ncbi:MAG: hypothetical protein M1830_000989 [Pleopsidium flavum]|nr:MAG: hypothetical protein M1830_000989 [Pleopsidium flavum]
MFRQSLTIVACALSAQGFLIPLEVANSAIEPSNNFHVSVIDPSSQTIKLDCPGCPFAEPTGQDGSYKWVSGVESSLVLNFTADIEHLSLNGVPFYPGSIFIPSPLLAPQIQAGESLVELKSAGYPPSLRLSYTLEFGSETQFPGDQGQIIPIHLKIIGIDSQAVSVATVFIQALKTSSRKFMILKVETIPDHAASPSEQKQPGKERECSLPPQLCRANGLLSSKVEDMKFNIAKAKAALAAKVAAMKGGIIKGCHGRLRPHHHGVSVAKPSHHAEAHHRHASPAHALARILAHVILPILVGIAAGVTASAIGMLVGRMIAFFWIRYKRGGKKGPYAAVVHCEDAMQGDGEKEGLMAGREEEPPVYEESEGAVVTVPEKEVV